MGLYEKLCEVLEEKRVLANEPMSKHTTFRIGGPADYFTMPINHQEIQSIITICKEAEIPYYIVGNGSNLLVGDKGYRGVIIQIYKNMNEIRVDGQYIYADAGALLSKVAAEALNHELKGFEFAAGIPGAVGGAVVMNAGAYGGEMKDVLDRATVITPEGELLTLDATQLELGYRTSIVARKSYVVFSAVFKLQPGSGTEIRTHMDELREKRVTKQPLEYPSAGSTFKRPEGHFAGKLIEDAGLRGFCVGDAQVAEKHCGFVINKGSASAADVISLMAAVADKVEAMTGVRLEPEVKRIGEF